MHYLVKPSLSPAQVYCLYLDQILCGGPEQALYPGGAEGPLVVAHNSINNCNNAKTKAERINGNDGNYFGNFDDAESWLRLGKLSKITPDNPWPYYLPHNTYYPEAAGFKLYAHLGLWPLKNISLEISAPDDPQWYFDQDELDVKDIYEEFPIWYKHKINEWLADRNIQQEKSAFEEDDALLMYGSGITWQEAIANE